MIPRGTIPIRFENMLLKAPSFKEMTKTWWNFLQVQGSSSYKLVTKLKRLKLQLKALDWEVFQGIKHKKVEALEKIKEWDGKEEIAPLFVLEIIEQEEAKEDYRSRANNKKISWRQKSRHD